VSDMTPFLQELKKKFETGEEGEEGQAGTETKGGGGQPLGGGKGPRKKS